MPKNRCFIARRRYRAPQADGISKPESLFWESQKFPCVFNQGMLAGVGAGLCGSRMDKRVQANEDSGAGCGLFVRVKFHHRLLEPAIAEQGDDRQAFVDAVIDQHLLFLARAMQHEVHDRLL